MTHLSLLKCTDWSRHSGDIKLRSPSVKQRFKLNRTKKWDHSRPSAIYTPTGSRSVLLNPLLLWVLSAPTGCDLLQNKCQS